MKILEASGFHAYFNTVFLHVLVKKWMRREAKLVV